MSNGLDDLDAIRQIASEHDIVIDAASASHNTSAPAIPGTCREKKEGPACCSIHPYLGNPILADQPVSGKKVDLGIYSDATDDIYQYEKSRGPYSQRITDIAVIEAGEELDVPTYILVPPIVYGTGSGPVVTISLQNPYLVRQAIKRRGLLPSIRVRSSTSRIVWSLSEARTLIYPIARRIVGDVLEMVSPTGRFNVATWRIILSIETGKNSPTAQVSEIDLDVSAARSLTISIAVTR